MGLLSPSVTVARYAIQEKIDGPIIETVHNALCKQSFQEIENRSESKSLGWTSFETSFKPNFEDSSFLVGAYMVFALRIDKKTVPPKLLKKHYSLAVEKKLADTGREYLSRNEKEIIREHVLNNLLIRIPAVPDIYDVIWNYEESYAWFFSGTKAANEEFESLFLKSFKISAIRLFPYTEADLVANLSDSERDLLQNLQPARFVS
jgi:recombination associated protein RdgC